MATVIDASVMAAQLLPDEAHSDFARALLEQLDNEERIAPVIYWYEIRNVLLKARRLRRIDQGNMTLALFNSLTNFHCARTQNATKPRFWASHNGMTLPYMTQATLRPPSGVKPGCNFRPKPR